MKTTCASNAARSRRTSSRGAPDAAWLRSAVTSHALDAAPKEGGARVDWRVVTATLSAIFLAEMGDKTQLAAVTMAASSGKPLSVFLGASVALTAVSAIGVLVGGTLGAYLPVEWIKRIAGVVFVLMGTLMLAGKL